MTLASSKFRRGAFKTDLNIVVVAPQAALSGFRDHVVAFDRTRPVTYTYTYEPRCSHDGAKMKTYSFKVVLERDGDAWHVYCPALEHLGGATWGKTQEEALKHINEVVQMIVQELREDGEPIPEDVKVSDEPLVSVTV
jgi:predicted RNase H-like HicB family nuclease